MGRRVVRATVGAAVGGVAAAAAWASISDGKPFRTVVAGVVVAVLSAFAPTVVDWVRSRRAGGVRGLVSELPASVAWLLHPAKEVIGFFGRGWLLRELENWCADRELPVVRLICAPGGYGKTRLARELASRLPK